jgi:hypothetical protein
MVGMDPPSRMNIGFTLAAPGATSGPFLVGVVAIGSDLARIGNATDSSVDVGVACVRVEDVGTVAAACVDRLRAASLPADEVVVDVITRSTREARLSEESLRRSSGIGPALGLGLVAGRVFVGCGTGGYWCLGASWAGVCRDRL